MLNSAGKIMRRKHGDAARRSRIPAGLRRHREVCGEASGVSIRGHTSPARCAESIAASSTALSIRCDCLMTRPREREQIAVRQ